MTDTPRGYELWDLDTGNCIGSYDTKEEALEHVRHWSETDAEAVALIEISADGSWRPSIAEGKQLLKLAKKPTKKKRKADR
jgi:hypothetical protein